MKTDKKRVIHIIDDDRSFCHNLSLQLSAMGYLVKKYASPIEFLSKLDEKIRGCIILDISMPEMDGLTLQKKLNELKVPLKIVFLSGHANVKKCAQAMKAGAIDFIEKPVFIKQIISAIEKAHELEEERIRIEESSDDSFRLYRSLTKREKEVFHLIANGSRSPQIAEKLGIKLSTVLMHRKNLFTKLDLHSIAEIVHFANINNLM